MNNFGYGLRSPYALKNFLRFAYENWGEPLYCLLLGAGTYEYKGKVYEKGVEKCVKNRLPVYEKGEYVGDYGYIPAGLVCHDWWFGEFTNDYYPEISIGRLPVKTLSNLREVIDKIVRFENNFGDYRNKIICVAEDEWSAGHLDLSFTNNMENVFVPIIPLNYDVYKIYSTEYKGTGQGEQWKPGENPGEKPGARKELIRAISQGAYIVVFWGHGCIEQIATEKVFVNPQSIEELANENKYCMFYFGSCGVAAFDRPYQDGMAEYLVTASKKGCVLTIGSTRIVSEYMGLSKNMTKSILCDSTKIAGEAFLFALLNSEKQNRVMIGDPLLLLSRRQNKILGIKLSDTLKGGNKFYIDLVTAMKEGNAIITAFSSAYLDSPDYNVCLLYTSPSPRDRG